MRVRHHLLSPMNARRSRDGKLELAITHGPFVTSYHPPPFATDLVRANGTGTLKSQVRSGVTPLMVA